MRGRGRGAEADGAGEHGAEERLGLGECEQGNAGKRDGKGVSGHQGRGGSGGGVAGNQGWEGKGVHRRGSGVRGGGGRCMYDQGSGACPGTHLRCDPKGTAGN